MNERGDGAQYLPGGEAGHIVMKCCMEVRFRFKLDEKEESWHGCMLMVESLSRALLAGGSALAVVS